MNGPVLVTGGNSFIGGAFVSAAAPRGGKVIATYRNNTDSMLSMPPANVQYHHCDLSNPDATTAMFDQYRFTAVVHLAAAIPGQNEHDYAATAERDNIQVTDILLRTAKKFNCRRFVFTSTISVYDGADCDDTGFTEDMSGTPNTVYGQSKLAGETLLEKHCGSEMQGVSLRMPGVHGVGKKSGAVYHFTKAAIEGSPLNVAEPHSKFRLLFIDDAVEALWAALTARLTRDYCCYNVAGTEIFTLAELAEKVLAITHSASRLDVATEAPSRIQILNIEKILAELAFSPKAIDVHLRSLQDQMTG